MIHPLWIIEKGWIAFLWLVTLLFGAFILFWRSVFFLDSIMRGDWFGIEGFISSCAYAWIWILGCRQKKRLLTHNWGCLGSLLVVAALFPLMLMNYIPREELTAILIILAVISVNCFLWAILTHSWSSE